MKEKIPAHRRRRTILAALALAALLFMGFGANMVRIYAADRLTIEVIEEIPASELVEFEDEEVPLAGWPPTEQEKSAFAKSRIPVNFIVSAAIVLAGGGILWRRRYRTRQFRLRRDGYRNE